MYANLLNFFQHPRNWDEVEKVVHECLDEVRNSNEGFYESMGYDQYQYFFINEATTAIRERLETLHHPHRYQGEYCVT